MLENISGCFFKATVGKEGKHNPIEESSIYNICKKINK